MSEEEKVAEDALADFDNSNDYDNVTCKTLVIGSEYDMINPQKLEKEVAEGINDVKFELIEDAGHLIFIEQGEKIRNVLKIFEMIKTIFGHLL